MMKIVEYKEGDGDWKKYTEVDSEADGERAIDEAKRFDRSHQLEGREYRIQPEA